ncbi:MAG: CoA-binding protein [Candidatus Diapherotrites archaeon]|nr:CoA-binding protein [Candidatus Diapherotrites archaeon]
MRIAIIGASKDRNKFGNMAVRAYKMKGWEVFPVNPHEKEIEGLKVYKSILDIPGELDRVSLYVPAKVSIKLIPEVKKKGIKDINVSPGAESDELIKALKDAGITPHLVCSIMMLGVNPDDLRNT